MTPLVSCIVPTYNSEKYLVDCLESILAQTWPSLEVIVVDDGSSDATVEIASGYRERVRVVSQNDCGPAETRNHGIRTATGELLAFLDPDDLWHEEKLARQMACLQNDPGLDMCVTHVQMFWDDAAHDQHERLREHPRVKKPVAGFATTTLLAGRSVFDRVGYFDSKYWFGDSMDWFLRARELGLRWHLLPDVLTYHRMHDTNLTQRRTRDSRDEFLRIVKASLDRRRSERAGEPK